MRPSLLAAAALAGSIATTPATALVVFSPLLQSDSRGEFDYQGTHYEGSPTQSNVTRAETQLLLGSRDTPEVRTAGRVSGDEMAVNARIDGKQLFSLTEMRNAGSQITFGTEISVIAAQAEHLFVAFHLPAGYVENQHNGELTFAGITSAVQASINTNTCAGGSCVRDQPFFFQALLESDFFDESHSAQAQGQPGLDVSPLLNATFTDSGPGFLRTRNLGFTDFDGVIDLGVLSAGQVMTFEYTMFARSEGQVGFSYGIGSINDPFFFSTDPVRQHPALRFFTLPVAGGVPEPASAWLLLAAGLAAAAARRRRAG